MKNTNSKEQLLRSIIREEIVSQLKESKLNEEGMEDLQAPLPAQVNKFLERTIDLIRSYNLPRKKEALVIAKVVDALGLDKSELNNILMRIKKAGVVQKESIKKTK